MGKGKGKGYVWGIIVFSGVYLFEFKNLRFGKEKIIKKKFNILLNTKLNIKQSNTKQKIINFHLNKFKYVNTFIFILFFYIYNYTFRD